MEPSPIAPNANINKRIEKLESSFGLDLKRRFFIGVFFSLTKLTNISDSYKLNLKILKRFEITQIIKYIFSSDRIHRMNNKVW